MYQKGKLYNVYDGRVEGGKCYIHTSNPFIDNFPLLHCGIYFYHSKEIEWENPYFR